MSDPIRLAISTCPNDTFAFHALLERQVDWRGLEFQIELLDIQQLNDRLFAGSFDVAKGSYHAALLLSEDLWVLPSGSALGFGVGPLLLSSRPDQHSPIEQGGETSDTIDDLVLCPGQHTTATLLLRMFYPGLRNIEQVVFSEIMPRLKNETAGFGVCIHEGRFTWQDEGLGLVTDLGSLWERETQCPLPLGGLFARRSLPDDLTWTVQQVIQDSLNYALGSPEAALPTMRRHAQEFDDEVLMQHVKLYVNEWTVDLGRTGENALQQLNVRAAKSGIIPERQAGLQVLRHHM